ncbi:histidinol-phosphate transaminase [Alkaliphilus sp. MSJ-5]|uniref:Histidinol-phosphate aminotransferase n=1 Tax=Alkaliphilus flagellatus TaxID=2841507 RepID=A0ABS6G0C0_9FIRM|nr:histidinol-phosphate transaminase [Alkaliphilus flagellatus]MBU5675813.1 histidinol-phosphate transaminase [Alkaliphilus flagellatus]
MSKNLFRKELDALRPYVPGKPIEEVQKEYGIDQIEKLASNENPLGPSPKAVEAIKREAENINIYPDAYAMKLKQEIAKRTNLSHENIVTGNGGEQIIQIIAQTFISHGDEALMADTTFGLYETSVLNMGGVPVQLPLKNYKHDLDGFIEKINDKTKIIYICNPNNPIGNILSKDEIENFVAKVPEDIVIVFDEAYYDYAKVNPDYPESLHILAKRPNTILLRTFSKVAGIAGVRVGYALTSKEIAAQMGKVKDVFNVNVLAQAAALGALEDTEHIEKTIKLNYDSIAIMEKYFEENDLEYIKSNANFIFANINTHSKPVFEELMKQGIIIRPGYLWKWDNWIRVSTGTIEQTEKFIDKLDGILKVEAVSC